MTTESNELAAWYPVVSGSNHGCVSDGKKDINTLFEALRSAYKSADFKRIVNTLIDEHGAEWRNLGGRESNYPTVHMSGSPGSSAVERLTNAIDATLELYAQRDSNLVTQCSPREFVEQILEGPQSHLTEMDKEARNKLADSIGIEIVFNDGDADNTPTIDFRDTGIGLRANEFADTIVSL